MCLRPDAGMSGTIVRNVRILLQPNCVESHSKIIQWFITCDIHFTCVPIGYAI